MAGVAGLRKIQLGAETTAGTARVATTIWRGPVAFIEDGQEVIFPEENVGYLSGVNRTMTVRKAATLSPPETEATFEQLPYFLMGGVASTSPTTSGGGTANTWVFTFATTAAPSIKTYTIEAGDNQEQHEMEYSFVENFSITGAAGESLKMSGTWRGRQKSLCDFTAGQSIPAVVEIPFSKGKLYIDAAGSLGSNVKSDTLLSIDLRVATGIAARYSGEGNLYFGALSYGPMEVLLDITFVYNATAVAEEAAFKAETARDIRLKWIDDEGTALQGSEYRELTIDLAGKWSAFSIVDAQDGDDVVTGTFKSQYEAASTMFAVITIKSALSALP